MTELINLVYWSTASHARQTGSFKNHIRIYTYNDENKRADKCQIAAQSQSVQSVPHVVSAPAARSRHQ